MTEHSDRRLTDRLRSHVEALAGEIGERNVWNPGTLDRAALYIESAWEEQGFSVRRQRFEARGAECSNLEVEIEGGARSGEIILLGAHYDTVEGSPGANDNGSGVAALLELSRLLRGSEPSRTLRFVAFANEEPPFFLSGEMGSRHCARAARERGDQIEVMVALETIGYYSDEPGSQRAPPVVDWFYPDRGSFLAFVGHLGSWGAVRRAAEAFEGSSDFPVERIVLPRLVPGISWSDHSSFWREGYDALMVTDTAPYRYPHYHRASDTPDRLDYEALAEVTRGLAGMAAGLAE